MDDRPQTNRARRIRHGSYKINGYDNNYYFSVSCRPIDRVGDDDLYRAVRESENHSYTDGGEKKNRSGIIVLFVVSYFREAAY